VGGRGRATTSTTAVARAFVDTNVLVYAVDVADPAKRRTARRVLEDAGPGDLVLSAQVLAEFYVVVTRKLATPLSEQVASAAVDRLAVLDVIELSADHVRSAIDLSRESKVSYWDASIIRAAIAGGCEVLLSEDLAAGRSFGALHVENPFVEA
jgi:predicted nucleic acid-binding protein